MFLMNPPPSFSAHSSAFGTSEFLSLDKLRPGSSQYLDCDRMLLRVDLTIQEIVPL